MKAPWFLTNPALYAQIKGQVAAAYPNLHFSIRDHTAFLSGSFLLMEGERIIDRFLIEIEFPSDYPRDIPMIREIGGRIPRTPDRHVYGSGGIACLFVPDEQAWACPEGSTLLDFLNGPVRNFFLGQSLFEIEGTWPLGQRSHGVKGILEFYAEILGVNNREIIVRYIDVLRRKEIKGHWLCPCGSGKKLRYCHISKVNKLRDKIHCSVASHTWTLIHKT
jgi:hypothetical protein